MTGVVHGVNSRENPGREKAAADERTVPFSGTATALKTGALQ
jgi:hypothetical protein